MRDGCVSCDCTDENNISWRFGEIWDYVVVGGWPMTYTTNMAGVRKLATGENTTIACAAYAGAATRTDLNTNEAN